MKMLIKFFSVIFSLLALSAFAGTTGGPLQFNLQATGSATNFSFSNLANNGVNGLSLANGGTQIVSAPISLYVGASFSANVNLPSISSSGLETVGLLTASINGGQLNTTFTPNNSDYTCSLAQQSFSGAPPFAFTLPVSCSVTPPPPPTTYGVTFNFNAGGSGLTLASATQPSFSNVLWSDSATMSMSTAYNLSFTNSSANNGAAFIESSDPNGQIINVNFADGSIFPIKVTKVAGQDNLTMTAAGSASLPSGDTCAVVSPTANSDDNETYGLNCSQQTNTYSYDLQLQGNSGASNILATPSTLTGAAWSLTGTMAGSSTDTNNYTYTFTSNAATYAGNSGSTNLTVSLKYAGQTYSLPATLTKAASGLATLTPQSNGNLPAGLTCAAGAATAPSNFNYVAPLVCTYVAPVTVQTYSVGLNFSSTDGNTYSLYNSGMSSAAVVFPWSSANPNSAVTPTLMSDAYQYQVPTTQASLQATVATNTISFPIAVNGSTSGTNYFYNAQFLNSVDKNGVSTVSLVAGNGSVLPPRTTCAPVAGTTNIRCTQTAETPVVYTYNFTMINSAGTTIASGNNLVGGSTAPWQGPLVGTLSSDGNTETYKIPAITPTAYNNSYFSTTATINIAGPAGTSSPIQATFSKTANGAPSIQLTNQPAGVSCSYGTISSVDGQNFTIPLTCAPNGYATQTYNDSFTLNVTGAGSSLQLANSSINSLTVPWAYNPSTMSIGSSNYNLSFTNTSANNGAGFIAAAGSEVLNINLSDANGSYVYPVTISKKVGDTKLTIAPAGGGNLPLNYSNCSITTSGNGPSEAYSLNCTYTPSRMSYLVQYSDSSTFPNNNEYNLSTTAVPSITFANSIPNGPTAGSYIGVDMADNYIVNYSGTSAGASSGVVQFPLTGNGSVPGTYYVGVQFFAGTSPTTETMQVVPAQSNLPPDIASCSVIYPSTSASSMYFRINCARRAYTATTISFNNNWNPSPAASSSAFQSITLQPGVFNSSTSFAGYSSSSASSTQVAYGSTSAGLGTLSTLANNSASNGDLILNGSLQSMSNGQPVGTPLALTFDVKVVSGVPQNAVAVTVNNPVIQKEMSATINSSGLITLNFVSSSSRVKK